MGGPSAPGRGNPDWESGSDCDMDSGSQASERHSADDIRSMMVRTAELGSSSECCDERRMREEMDSLYGRG